MLADISRIASGQFIAQLMLLVAIPFITRYYNPEEFGLFAIFSAIAWILVSFSTGRMESLIITMKNKNKAVALTIGVLTTILIFSFVVVLIAEPLLPTALLDLSSNSAYLSMLIGVTVLFIGSAQTLRCYATYLGHFSGHGVAAVLNSVGVISVSLGYAILIEGDSLFVGLILGQIIGHALSFFVFLFYTDIISMTNLKMFKPSFSILLHQAKKIPVLLSTQLSSTVAARMSTLIVFVVGGISSAGSLAIAERIISAPTNIFGQSIGQVVRHRYSKAYKIDKQNMLLPRKVITLIFPMVVIGYGLIITLADWFVPLFLGDQWKVAIIFVQIIAVMELFNFVFYSVEDVAIIRGNYVYRMWGQLAQLLLLVIMYLIFETESISLGVEWVLGLICFTKILLVVYDLSRTWRQI
ncbi:oligosaccharide flippase family protein [Candidatus Woesearchaeota archaeon]|nr:oligosaccharide flippase family protein [Candidatus Woesearchaeota archaeon]